MQEMWNRFQARGHVDAKATVRFDGSTWHPYIEVLTEDLSVNAEFFPYPLTNIGGKIIYNDGHLIAKTWLQPPSNKRCPAH